MKRYKVSKALFCIFPIFIFAIIMSYLLILYKKSYTWVNLTNIALDAIILVYYVFKFCHEVSMDSQGINFYTLLKKHRVERKQIRHIRYSSFLTKITSDTGSFYILTTPTGGRIIKNMFKELAE